MTSLLKSVKKRVGHTLKHQGAGGLALKVAMYPPRVLARLRHIAGYLAYHPRSVLVRRSFDPIPESSDLGDLITIIIPFKDGEPVLRKCVHSILAKTTYRRYEMLLIDNGSKEAATESYLATLHAEKRIRIVRYREKFNYAAIHNWAMQLIDSEYVLFLNSDTEVITPGWLEAMLGLMKAGNVGAVGALLLFPNGKVQHAGVTVGLYREQPRHIYARQEPDGTLNREILTTRECAALTGACMLIRKSLYTAVGGLDAENLAIAFNDVDLCLKLREKGYKIIYTPKARLYHHESYSRGHDYRDPQKRRREARERKFLRNKWKKYDNNDPFYTIGDDLRRRLILLFARKNPARQEKRLSGGGAPRDFESGNLKRLHRCA